MSGKIRKAINFDLDTNALKQVYCKTNNPFERLKAYQRDSIKSPLLANQAIEEMKKKGYVTMICPKCKTIPEVIMKGNKTIVKCECGYVSDMEIEF